MPKKTINVNKTVTIGSTVFSHILAKTEASDGSFSEELNNLCRDGMEARKAAANARNPPADGDGDEDNE